MSAAPDNTAEPHFPAPCPQCLAELGYPRKAATVANEPSLLRLTVRCDACGHEWPMQRDGVWNTAVSLMPKQPVARR